MPLRNLKYSQKIQVLFIPVFVLMAIGLLVVYQIAARSLAAEHRERLQRTAHLTEEGLQSTVREMMKLADLFQINRTLKEYLYISTVLGGDRKPLKDLLSPLKISLGIDDLDLFDVRGKQVLDLDSVAGHDVREDQLTAITGVLPPKVMYGFTETSKTLKIVAVSPLKVVNDIVGYISVGKYIDHQYLDGLKDISGNELFEADAHDVIILENGELLPFTPRNQKLAVRGVTYSVLERKLSGLRGEELGSIIIALSDEDLIASTNKLKLSMIGMIVAAALISVVLARLFKKALVEPLDKITQFTGKVARGELDENLHVAGTDEVALLARHFNDMKRQLREQRDVVNRYTDNLEQAVESRTSELNRVQRQLLHAQKMEAVGQLAGGIAHDFNNFLTAIIGYAGLYQKKLQKDDPLRIYADQIVAISKRASNMTRSLLTFSKKQVFKPQPVDLNEIIAGIEKVVLRLIGEDIELKTFLPEGPLAILADAGQIEQVLLNLATNARDAMPHGGRLTIKTGIAYLDQALAAKNAGSIPGNYAVMSVADTGTGMDTATKDKIFEPFFTTKDTGKGTGLGLAVVYGIIQQHNGFINVFSDLGVGTTIIIYLPLIPSAPEKAWPEEHHIAPPGGTETILIAEDNDIIRELVRSGLEEEGYSLIVATDGADAVDKFMKAKNDISLVILDVIMPKKSAKAVYEEIMRIKPGVKILFTSGYTADFLLTKGMLDSGVDLIQKPMSLNDLLRKIRELIDQDAASPGRNPRRAH